METTKFEQLTIFDDFELYEFDTVLYSDEVVHVENEIHELIYRNYQTGDKAIVLAGRLQFWDGRTFGYRKLNQQIINVIDGDYRNVITINEAGELQFAYIHHDGRHLMHLYVINEDDFERVSNESIDAVQRLINLSDTVKVDNTFRNEFGFEPVLTLEDAIDKLTGSDNEFFKMVIEDISELDTLDEAKTYLYDVSNYGCISGTVSRLIYTKDIKDVFSAHAEDAFDILDGADINLSDFGAMREFVQAIVWTAYEVAAGRILDELEEIEGGSH